MQSYEMLPTCMKIVEESRLEKSRDFIHMIDFLKKNYSKQEYKYILQNIVKIKEKDVLNLTFRNSQYMDLMVFYLSESASKRKSYKCCNDIQF